MAGVRPRRGSPDVNPRSNQGYVLAAASSLITARCVRRRKQVLVLSSPMGDGLAEQTQTHTEKNEAVTLSTLQLFPKIKKKNISNPASQ